MFISFTEEGAMPPQEFIDVIRERFFEQNIPFDKVYFPCPHGSDNKYKEVEVKNVFGELQYGTAALKLEDLSEETHSWLDSL